MLSGICKGGCERERGMCSMRDAYHGLDADDLLDTKVAE